MVVWKKTASEMCSGHFPGSDTSNRLWSLVLPVFRYISWVFGPCFVILGFLKNLHDWEGLAYWNVLLHCFWMWDSKFQYHQNLYPTPPSKGNFMIIHHCCHWKKKGRKNQPPLFLARGPAVGEWPGIDSHNKTFQDIDSHHEFQTNSQQLIFLTWRILDSPPKKPIIIRSHLGC